MFPQNSKKITFDNFMGLYARGLPDDVPKDHFISLVNMVTTRKGQLSTRNGFTLTAGGDGSPILRLFVSTISGVKYLLLLDNTGNLRANGTIIYSNSLMTDFSAINLFNKTFILPIVSSTFTPTPMQVWTGSGNTRPALGAAPGTSMTGANSGTGNVVAGVHKFAVSFITSTGFTTPPGPVSFGFGFTPVSVTATGGQSVTLSNLPIGPTGTVARQIFATQANLNNYYYVASSEGGLINDNSTTSTVLSFLDTDLAVDASSLFNLTEEIAAGPYGWLTTYHGRLIVLGQTISVYQGVTTNSNADIVRISNSGDAESFDLDTGFLQIPSQNDDNVSSGAIQINDNLYITKSRAGIYSVSDNFDVPTTWTIIPADFSSGGVGYGIASVQSNTTAAEILDFALICDRTGLYAFNGTIQYPALSYKIDDIWKSSFSAATVSNGVNLVVDTFENLIYITVPGVYPYILVGDYSQGLNSESIIWSNISVLNSIYGATTILFGDIGDSVIALRVVPSDPTLHTNIYTLSQFSTVTTDNGNAINWQVQFAYAEYEEGQINVFNAIRLRTQSNSSNNSNINFGAPLTSAPALIAKAAIADVLRQINYMYEKLSVSLSGGDTYGGITLQRMDVFGKPIFPSRPG